MKIIIWNSDLTVHPVFLFAKSVRFGRFSSDAQLCPTLQPHGLQHSLLPYPPEFTQTHVHRVSDAIQPSHPLASPSRPTFSLSQHQGLFQWITSSHQVAKVLELQLQFNSVTQLCPTLCDPMNCSMPGLPVEKEMATHSSVLAWRIPGTGSLVGCHLGGHTESDTTEVT